MQGPVVRKPLDINIPNTTDIFMNNLYKFKQEGLKISFVGEVTSVDNYQKSQCVDVSLLINDIYPIGTLNARVLRKVFVALDSGNGFSIKLPVAVGDLVRVHWSHKNLTEFLEGDGSAVDVDINRTGNMNDCWAELGFGTRSNNLTPSTTDFIIEGPKTTIDISQSGKITINTQDDVSVTTTKNLTAEVDGDASVTVGGDTTLDVTGNVTGTCKAMSLTATDGFTLIGDVAVQGAISATGNMSINGTITGQSSISADTIAASSSLTVQGSDVYGHTHDGNVPAFS